MSIVRDAADRSVDPSLNTASLENAVGIAKLPPRPDSSPIDSLELSQIRLPRIPKENSQFVQAAVVAQEEPDDLSVLLKALYRTGPLIGGTRESFIQEPLATDHGRNWASNFEHDRTRAEEVTIYINGFTYGEKGFIDSISALCNAYGREAVVIVNDQERSLFGDIFNAAAGTFSSKGGGWAENQAVRSLNREILKAHHAGKRVRLVPYSQGAIIAGNALTLLKEAMGKNEWDKLNLEVETYGAALHDFPTGKKVTEYRLSRDNVARGTSWLANTKRSISNGYTSLADGTARKWSGIKHWWNGTTPEPEPPKEPESQVAEVVYLQSDKKGAHLLQTYMGHQADFFLERRRVADGKLDSTRIARDLITSIQSGRYADWVHDAILSKTATNRTVAVAMLAAVNDAQQIGKYRIPDATYRRLQRTVR